MGFGIRTFKVDPNGELRRFSYARFKRLYDGEALEALPEHAGGHADFAIVYVRTRVDRPVAVTNIEFTRLHLDASGRFNETERLRRLRAAGELLDAWHQDQYRQRDSSRILPAANRFARKRHDREFSWEPSKAQRATLVKLLDSWPQKLPRR
jgi:hypothetical protein